MERKIGAQDAVENILVFLELATPEGDRIDIQQLADGATEGKGGRRAEDPRADLGLELVESELPGSDGALLVLDDPVAVEEDDMSRMGVDLEEPATPLPASTGGGRKLREAFRHEMSRELDSAGSGVEGQVRGVSTGVGPGEPLTDSPLARTLPASILDDERRIDRDNSVRALVFGDEVTNGIEGRDAGSETATDDALGIALERDSAGVILVALPREIDSDERRDGPAPAR